MKICFLPSLLALFLFGLGNCQTAENQKGNNYDYAQKLTRQTQTNFTQKEVVDTTTLKGKRMYIKNQYSLAYYRNDTLLDFNYDNQPDYVVFYHRGSGTGMKNMAQIYFYDTSKNQYTHHLLPALSNPTFYLKHKKITAFYIGHGSGEGHRFEWKNKRWVITKKFTVNGTQYPITWQITYPLRKHKENIQAPYQPIPPNKVLQTNVAAYVF